MGRMSFDDNTGQYFTLPDEKKHIFACGSTGMWVIEFDFIHDDGTFYHIYAPVSGYNFTLQQNEVSRLSTQDRKKLDMLVNEDMISSDCSIDNKRAELILPGRKVLKTRILRRRLDIGSAFEMKRSQAALARRSNPKVARGMVSSSL